MLKCKISEWSCKDKIDLTYWLLEVLPATLITRVYSLLSTTGTVDRLVLSIPLTLLKERIIWQTLNYCIFKLDSEKNKYVVQRVVEIRSNQNVIRVPLCTTLLQHSPLVRSSQTGIMISYKWSIPQGTGILLVKLIIKFDVSLSVHNFMENTLKKVDFNQ